MTKFLYRWMAFLAAAAALALGLANLFFGELNQDEGWYLYAARLVSVGRWPYRDFAFTQAPVLALFYAPLQPLMAAGGVGAGRAITLALSLFSFLFAAALARRLGGRELGGWAALAAFILASVNVYQAYFGTVVKTYALCGLLLTAGAWALAVARDRRSLALYALAGFLFAASAGTRLSAGLMLPVVGVYLLLQRERCGRHAWFTFGLGGLAGLLLLLLPFYVAAPEAFRFFVIDYHSAREAGGLAAQLVYKAGCLSRLVQAYFVAAALGVVLLLARPFRAAPAGRDALTVALWLGLLAILILHFSAPFPYDDYQAPLYPLLAALLAVASARALATWAVGPRAAAMAGLLLLCGAAAFSSPVVQSWKVIGRDRIWWRFREQPALLQLREVARDLRARSGDAAELLTQDAYLAVETGLRLPPGLEMGPFSYFPGLSDDEAARLHVVNRNGLAALLEGTSARVAAFSEYSFVLAAPGVAKLSEAEQAGWWAAVEQRFAPVRTVPDFGQGATALRIYERRGAEAPR